MFRAREVAALYCVLACIGCRQDMADQPHIKPLEASDFFDDGLSSRPLVAGTVARGHLQIDSAYYAGQIDGKPIVTFPLPTVAEQLRLSGDDEHLMAQVLERGRERFDIFCAACHDRTGSGQGMVVQRGFPAPPSYHIQRLRDAPIGHFYDVISHGLGRMPDYASQVPPADRWAIVAYIRALQLSQHADANRLPELDREALRARSSTP